MAKKKRKKSKQLQFFEALPGASTLPMPGGIDVQPWEDRAIQLGRDLAGYASATARDLGHFGRYLARKLSGRNARRSYLALIVLGATVVTGAALLIASSTYAIYSSDLTSPSALANKHKTGTTILDRNGKVLYEVYGASTRTDVKFGQVPQNLINATLAAEDANFFNHSGVDPRGIVRALYTDMMHRGTVEGGSTLTQQLVKNTLLTPERSVTRKVQEITLAIEMERRYTKQQIIEMYLNDIYYGQGSYGVGTAAQTYFKKDVKDLTLGESALLAGLPLGPSRFDPTVNLPAAIERRNYVLDRMASLGQITAEQATAAKAESIVASPHQITINAPWFDFYVLDQLRAKYGDDMVERGGITVTTTLDLDRQNLAQQLTRDQIDRLRYRHVTNAALVSTDPSTGEIISMVGSYDYNDPNYGTVNLTTSDRQPGSSIKPVCYLGAFTKGMNGASPLDDKPLSIPDGSGQVYKPTDYDGKFRGVVTVRRAIAGSLNVPAVNMLKQVGVGTCLDMAHNLGITTLNDTSRYGLSLTLGAGEVKMIDMAEVYGTLANGGVKVPLTAIKKVADRDGNDITKPDPKPSTKPVVDPRLVYMMTNILSDNDAKTEIFGSVTPFKIAPHQVAVKTGTTTDFRDNWTVGYTPDIVTVVWAGNNDNTPMGQVDGFTGAAPIWHDYMANFLKDHPVHNFTRPAGLVTAKVCSATGDGGLANPWDKATEELFLAEAPITRKCNSAAPKPPETPSPTPPPNSTPVPVTTPVVETPKPDKNPFDHGGPNGH